MRQAIKLPSGSSSPARRSACRILAARGVHAGADSVRAGRGPCLGFHRSGDVGADVGTSLASAVGPADDMHWGPARAPGLGGGQNADRINGAQSGLDIARCCGWRVSRRDGPRRRLLRGLDCGGIAARIHPIYLSAHGMRGAEI